MLVRMRGRALALSCVLAGLVAPPSALAQVPGDAELDDAGEIEMDPPEDGSTGGVDGDPGAEPESAEPPPVVKDPKLAKKLARSALQLVRKGDYQARRKRIDEANAHYVDAIAAYKKAIELGDDLGVYYELALVEEKLARIEDAVRHLRIVVLATEGVRPDVQKKASEKRDELLMQVGVVRLKIETEGATIAIDGADIGTAPLAEPIVLRPGTYTLTLSADGFEPKDAELKIEAGSEVERHFELDPIRIVVEPLVVDDEEPAPAPPPPPPSKLPLYVGGGVTVAALGVGITTGLLAVGKHGTFTGQGSSASEREDARSSGKQMALISDISLGTAVVAAGFTAYWYFSRYKPALATPDAERRAPEMSKLDVVPWVQQDAGGVVSGLGVTGSF